MPLTGMRAGVSIPDAALTDANSTGALRSPPAERPILKDGGPEALVWWAFLIIPLAIAALVVVGIILTIVL